MDFDDVKDRAPRERAATVTHRNDQAQGRSRRFKAIST
jgi:hypothetical protein